MSTRNTVSMRARLSAAAIATLLVGAGALGGTTAAFAAGSDSPTPYTVTAEGVTLPGAMTFVDNGHVNVRSNQGNRGIHFESLNNMPSGKWIGQSFLPWSAFGYDTDSLCVEWVQIAEFNEHFGEGGQDPVGNGCTVPEGKNPGTEEPVIETPETEKPGAEVPGTENPAPEEPGVEEPGSEKPGTENPAPEEPGVEEPGVEEPGTENPESEKPGPETPTDPTDPKAPTGPSDPEITTDPTDPAIPALPLSDGAHAAALAATGQDIFPLALLGGAALATLIGGAGALVAARRRA